MLVCYPEYAGRPYRPSNGTEGMLFEERFCDRCVRFASECEIYAYASCYPLDSPLYPKQWVYDEEGKPTCTAFQDRYQGDLFDAENRTLDRRLRAVSEKKGEPGEGSDD